MGFKLLNGEIVQDLDRSAWKVLRTQEYIESDLGEFNAANGKEPPSTKVWLERITDGELRDLVVNVPQSVLSLLEADERQRVFDASAQPATVSAD